MSYTEGEGRKVVDSGILVTDPDDLNLQSATVQIKARIDNRDGRFYSGERCTLELPST